jgi:hypothetical protein
MSKVWRIAASQPKCFSEQDKSRRSSNFMSAVPLALATLHLPSHEENDIYAEAWS